MNIARKAMTIVAAASFAGAAALIACHPAYSQAQEQADSPSNISASLPSEAAQYTAEDYADIFPDEVGSFMSGTSQAEDEDNGYVHSHATLAEHVEPMLPQPTSSMACIACKSTDFNALYAQEGKQAFATDATNYVGNGKYWDCGICHEGTPGGTLHPNLAFYQLIGKTTLSQVSTEEAVCGQCHNAVGRYGRSWLADYEGDIASIDPYRYGFDPDSLKQAFLEDGVQATHEEDTGADVFITQHPDIEIFQGSVHEKLGLTCVSCHMPTKTNEDGQEYTSHDASSTPLENEEALEFCLTCHKDQGVDNTDEMRTFIETAEADLGEKEQVVQDKIAQAQQLLAKATSEGGIDEETLEQAREQYATAKWYNVYAHGSAEKPGQKVAHNPAAERFYQEKAADLLDQAIASLDSLA
ncbi:MAG: ammonia-forming cytochrome c nitrite reductase subunit c552 [Coriobacteriia bacterium]|nr:ammonia-forming cytochrome c nitrite reductase subunit c552 [Coriobacteriia bacterium]